METVTLCYDKNNSIAKSIIEILEKTGIFDMLRDDEPNEVTIQAIEDARNGNTYKAKNLDDLFQYLKS